MHRIGLARWSSSTALGRGNTTSIWAWPGGFGLGWCRFLSFSPRAKSCSVPSLERITGRSDGPLGHFLLGPGGRGGVVSCRNQPGLCLFWWRLIAVGQ